MAKKNTGTTRVNKAVEPIAEIDRAPVRQRGTYTLSRSGVVYYNDGTPQWHGLTPYRVITKCPYTTGPRLEGTRAEGNP